MPLPPLRFTPLLKPRAWGGHRLQAFGKDVRPAPAPAIGESWEIADLGPPVPDGVSRVATGPFRGATLSDLMMTHRTALLGRARDCGGRFPLLVKYLDAAENLSLQVHPTAAYAAGHPGSHLKTESWFVLDAAPGARSQRLGARPDHARGLGVQGAAGQRHQFAVGRAVDGLQGGHAIGQRAGVLPQPSQQLVLGRSRPSQHHAGGMVDGLGDGVEVAR